jgi:hypothetical protein
MIDLCYNECIESCAQRRSGAFSFLRLAPLELHPEFRFFCGVTDQVHRYRNHPSRTISADVLRQMYRDIGAFG